MQNLKHIIDDFRAGVIQLVDSSHQGRQLTDRGDGRMAASGLE